MVHYGHMFRLLHSGCSQALNTALAQMELTSAQGRVMGYLARREQPPCAKDIEEEFHLSHPTVSGLLSRLEKKNFIVFRPDEKDGRCKRIVISEKGIRCHERIYHVISENEQRIVRGFSREEQEQFASLLVRAVENMGGQIKLQMEEEETNE